MGPANGAGKGKKAGAQASESTLLGALAGDEKATGSWLCNEGHYRDYLDALSKRNPSLKKQDPNNELNPQRNGNALDPLRNGNALVVLLDASAEGAPVFTTTEFKSANDLQKHFNTTRNDAPASPRRRIYIMEGLAKDFISYVGGHFFMDPSFFQRQERTCVWSNDFTPTSDMLPYPSSLDPDCNFHLQYCELRKFSKALLNRYHFCARTRRHVGMTPARDEENSTIGILRRKVGWWCRETNGGGWDAVILCDPELTQLSPNPAEHMTDGSYREIHNPDNLKNSPFQDGYVDFLPPSPHPVDPEKNAHPHKSMLRDLIYYYMNHSDHISAEEWLKPTASSLFVKKIVAAHCLQLVDYIKVMLPSLELKLTTAWVDEQEQWKSLQTISRRCGNYRDDVEDTLLSLNYALEAPRPKPSRNWKDCEKDFQYIYFRLKILKERADTLIQSMTGLASIAGNRQSLEEAKRVKRLNLLALLFIPLAYTSSLFSMQDSFAPGNGRFWVYWVSALSVVALTVVVTWVLDSALTDEAQWQVPFEKWLGGWSESVVKMLPKKRKSGFFPKG